MSSLARGGYHSRTNAAFVLAVGANDTRGSNRKYREESLLSGVRDASTQTLAETGAMSKSINIYLHYILQSVSQDLGALNFEVYN
jgi:hypothetical protein